MGHRPEEEKQFTLNKQNVSLSSSWLLSVTVNELLTQKWDESALMIHLSTNYAKERVNFEKVTDILHELREGNVLPISHNVRLAPPHQRRQKQPQPGHHHERHRQRTRHDGRQRPLTPLKRPLNHNLNRQTHPVEEKEAREVPRGLCPTNVIEYKLVHHRRDEKGGENSWQLGPLPSNPTAGDLPDRFVNRRVQDPADHDVPPPPPEVLEGGGQVGLVELRLEVNAEKDSSRGGDKSQNKLQTSIHVNGIKKEKELRVDEVLVVEHLNWSGEYESLGGVVESGLLALFFILGFFEVGSELDGETSQGDEMREGRVGR